jgi:hypothetical protein
MEKKKLKNTISAIKKWMWLTEDYTKGKNGLVNMKISEQKLCKLNYK